MPERLGRMLDGQAARDAQRSRIASERATMAISGGTQEGPPTKSLVEERRRRSEYEASLQATWC